MITTVTVQYFLSKVKFMNESFSEIFMQNIRDLVGDNATF